MINKGLILDSYATLVFDCDGVLLNSNKVKTRAFYQAALPFGEAAAQALADYHVANGGVSRYKKFAYFLENIAASSVEGVTLDTLLKSYAEHVITGLLNCEIANDLIELRSRTPDVRWLIVSGGDQTELRSVFEQRGLSTLFDGGIFGSPDIKEDILARELDKGTIVFPALFIGDSKYDYMAATGAELDFVFLSEWSEVEDWEQWSFQNKIRALPRISSLLGLFTPPLLVQQS
nr:HAD family hydrolase [uncultured Pseudomonas sp.]